MTAIMHAEQGVVLPLLQLKAFDQYTTTHSLNVSVLAMKGPEMKRGAIVGLKVLAAALLALFLSNVTNTSYTAHAQGAIGQQPPGDPTGAATGTAADVTVKDPKNPSLSEVMETVGHNKIAINVMTADGDGTLEVTVPVRAGSRVVGATFVATNFRPSLDIIRHYDRQSLENNTIPQIQNYPAIGFVRI